LSDLPTGWADTTLERVADWGSGGTPSRSHPDYYGGSIPWIKTGELGQGLITDTEEKITQAALDNSSAKIFPKGSVALAMYGATIGKVAILGIDAATNQACAVGIPRPRVTTNKYLLHYLTSQKQEFVAKGQGGAQPNISQGIIKAWPIPLAPLREQERITAKLDALLERINECRIQLNRVPQILKKFREAVLEAAVSGRLTEEWRGAQVPTTVDAKADVDALLHAHTAVGGHRAGNAAPPTSDVHDLEPSMFPQEWGLIDLRDAIEPGRPITYGILKPGPEVIDGIPYIRVADYPNNRLNPSTVRKTSKSIESEFARARLREGDLLLSIRGTVGRLIVIPKELEGANITQDSARLSVQRHLNKSFVMLYLKSQMAQQRMKRATKGVAVRGINIGDVRALQLPVPSLSEQQEIASRVDALFAFADTLDCQHQQAVALAGKLTPSVLAKAFRGELVPQDPNDEPAGEMLERMRRARDTDGEGKSVTKPIKDKVTRQVFGKRRRRLRASSA
jgi:type I restriction enzyme S subunit